MGKQSYPVLSPEIGGKHNSKLFLNALVASNELDVLVFNYIKQNYIF